MMRSDMKPNASVRSWGSMPVWSGGGGMQSDRVSRSWLSGCSRTFTSLGVHDVNSP